MPHEPCITAPMKPRERTGQVSIARAAPAGHSAPMPMPSKARKRNSRKKLGAKPARKLQTEYQAIEIISGVLRPMRAASPPLAGAPIGGGGGGRPPRWGGRQKAASTA